jgi:hypothetical protein
LEILPGFAEKSSSAASVRQNNPTRCRLEKAARARRYFEHLFGIAARQEPDNVYLERSGCVFPADLAVAEKGCIPAKFGSRLIVSFKSSYLCQYGNVEGGWLSTKAGIG